MEQTHSKSHLFLIEMIIIILFLSIASALCVRVFVASHKKSVGAEELSRAKELAGGVADIIRGSGEDDTVDLASYYPQGTPTEKGMLLYYDEDWAACDSEKQVYSMEIVIAEEEKERQGYIRVLDKDGQEIYALEVVVHVRYKATPLDGGI